MDVYQETKALAIEEKSKSFIKKTKFTQNVKSGYKPDVANIIKLDTLFKNVFEFQLEDGIQECKKKKKHLLLYFTNYNDVEAKRFENKILNDSKLRNKIEDAYVLKTLITDDISTSGRYSSSEPKIKNIGDKNRKLQVTNFNYEQQPYLVILNEEGSILKELKIISYENFISFID